MAQGVVKSYDPNTGNGIVILDTDKTEVFLAPGSLKGSIFMFRRLASNVLVLSEGAGAKSIKQPAGPVRFMPGGPPVLWVPLLVSLRWVPRALPCAHPRGLPQPQCCLLCWR